MDKRMPPEKLTPVRIPRLAMIIITKKGAALAPMADFKKLKGCDSKPNLDKPESICLLILLPK